MKFSFGKGGVRTFMILFLALLANLKIGEANPPIWILVVIFIVSIIVFGID